MKADIRATANRNNIKFRVAARGHKYRVIFELDSENEAYELQHTLESVKSIKVITYDKGDTWWISKCD